MKINRRQALAAGGALLSSFVLPARAQGKPVRIGSTLPLTGPLASLAIIHKVTAEICVENLNKRGGLLGRPVEWVLRDDQSKPELTRTIYEQLITADKVDLIQSPYATASILAAMGVAQRYNKMLLHTSFGIPRLAKYDMQFQTAGSPFDPEVVWPNHVFDAAAKLPKPPRPSPSSPASSRRCTPFRSARAKSLRSAACRKCCISSTSSAIATSVRSRLASRTRTRISSGAAPMASIRC
jgi:branched-chain amino acid transport system substrate-binding protein